MAERRQRPAIDGRRADEDPDRADRKRSGVQVDADPDDDVLARIERAGERLRHGGHVEPLGREGGFQWGPPGARRSR